MRVGDDGSPPSSFLKCAENPNISEFTSRINTGSLVPIYVSCCEVVGGRGYMVMESQVAAREILIGHRKILHCGGG